MIEFTPLFIYYSETYTREILMQPEMVQEMTDFILKAKQATYVGGGDRLLPYRLGSHDLQYQKGDWTYHDCYFGESDFIGGEIVYHHGKVVWGLNYYGRILLPEKITSATAGKISQESLSEMYRLGRFLGGFKHTIGEFTYTDTNTGNALYFTGREWIDKDTEMVYALDYHGGLIKA
jgi:hypothetical protein